MMSPDAVSLKAMFWILINTALLVFVSNFKIKASFTGSYFSDAF